MLENLRRQGSSVFIYVIFGILIAMFVINFRPGGQRGDDAGCTSSGNTAISIDGNEVNLTSFRVAFGAFTGPTRARTEHAFETLIRRELLASEAATRGIIVSDSLIDDQIKKGMFFLGGDRQKAAIMFEQHDDGTQTWSLRGFKQFVASFNISMSSFREEQQRELQAQMMAQILGEGVRVSTNEAYESWRYDHTTVTYDSVVFRPDAYRQAIRITDDDAARFLTTHEAEVKARYTADQKSLYDNKPAQIRVRSIFIAKAEPEAAKAPADEKKDEPKKDEAKKDEAKKDDKALAAAPKAPIGMPIEAAKAKLEAARADIVAGKKKFADVAKELSTDEATKWSGGALGWRDVDAPALGDKLVNDAAKPLKQGEVSQVIVTDRGAYLITVEGTRSGKLDFDAVKLEIAAVLAKDLWSNEAAHRDAIAALERARAGTGKNLDQIFEREAEAPQMDEQLQKILNDPSITTKQKQDILRQYIQMQQQHGSLHIEGRDQPVAWFAEADAVGSAAEAAGSAATPAAAGSAAIPAAGAPAASEDLMKPSSDVLPTFTGVVVPKVKKNGPAPRAAKLPGVGTSKAAVDALFDDLTPGMIAKTLYRADGNYVVLQLQAKSAPDLKDFDKESDHVLAEMRARRSSAAVLDWLKTRCETLAKNNRISWSHDLLRESGADGKPLPETYHPCQSFAAGADADAAGAAE